MRLYKIAEGLKCPRKILLHISRSLEKKGFFDKWSDESWIKIRYWLRNGNMPDLDNPQTYTEKLQWLKLYNRNPLYTKLVDKYEVKKYVAACIGDEYIIPTLGVWDNFEDIPFDELPDQFVLKCTHDSGGIVICKDKSKLDKAHARTVLNCFLQSNYYLRTGREWPYKNVKPRIMAEVYMEDDKTQELRDYKFFTFDGIVRALYIASDRQNSKVDTKFDFYDSNFIHLDIVNGHPNAKDVIEKPSKFDAMKSLAEKLSVGIPHVRVDLYEVNGKIYYGEYTFFHLSGMTPFKPEIWDKTFGDWLQLPAKYNG